MHSRKGGGEGKIGVGLGLPSLNDAERPLSAKDGRIKPRDDILQKLFFDKAPSLARDSL